MLFGGIAKPLVTFVLDRRKRLEIFNGFGIKCAHTRSRFRSLSVAIGTETSPGTNDINGQDSDSTVQIMVNIDAPKDALHGPKLNAVKLRDKDILKGRGPKISQHLGNVAFRSAREKLAK